MIHKVKVRVRRLLGSVGYEVRSTKKQTRLVYPNIPGWFTYEEAEVLYLLGFMARGRVLEIGHFLGRSTSVLCEAIRDSGRTVEFNSYDIGFKSADEFVEFYSRVYGSKSFPIPPEMEAMIFSRKMTTTQIAQEYLTKYGLAEYVALHSADFNAHGQSRYDFIFCDAMHDAREIRVNLPGMVQNSADNCTWAVHDMTAANVATLLAEAPAAKLIVRADTLGVFQYIRS